MFDTTYDSTHHCRDLIITFINQEQSAIYSCLQSKFKLKVEECDVYVWIDGNKEWLGKYKSNHHAKAVCKGIFDKQNSIFGSKDQFVEMPNKDMVLESAGGDAFVLLL